MKSEQSEKPGWNPENFKTLINESGVRMEDLADAIGVSKASIYHYKTPQHTCPTLGTAIRAADFFGVPLDYLCGRCDRETAEAVLSDFKGTFRKLSRGRYEVFALQQDGRYIRTGRFRGVEAPWPYNLLDDLLEWHRGSANRNRDEADRWQSVLTKDQRSGLGYALRCC